MNIHASCVNIRGRGVLILGASGAGKSDLALRLIAFCGAKLVADDRVDIEEVSGGIKASAPEILKGLIEVRGVGLVKLKAMETGPVDLIVELISSIPERMPDPAEYELCGVRLPLVRLNPFEISAPAKVLAALSLL